MRLIKFRGMSKSKWIYGELFYRNNIYSIKEEFTDNVYTVDEKTLSQFTGLIDRNNKEIYEGDLIQHNSGLKAIVIWNEEIIGFSLLYLFMKDKMTTLLNSNSREWRVISNIYDNPDLKFN